MGKQLRIRPSDYVGIDDEVVAWSFDNAVQMFGNALERRLHEVSSKAKNKDAAERKSHQEMTKWLYSDNPERATGRFRDPMKFI